MRPYSFVIIERIESITQVLLFIIIYSSTHLFSNSECKITTLSINNFMTSCSFLLIISIESMLCLSIYLRDHP